MAKLTKRQKKINEMLADFAQPTSAMVAIQKLQEIAAATSKFDEILLNKQNIAIIIEDYNDNVFGGFIENTKNVVYN